jgi:hypothetical protein
MMIFEPKQGFRQVDITDRRTKIDFAHSMKHITELYPEASVIRVVLDNLNTHKWRPCMRFFPPSKRATWRRGLVEFHTTPKQRQMVK